eukprot:5577356-Amphidinium_carterae.1
MLGGVHSVIASVRIVPSDQYNPVLPGCVTVVKMSSYCCVFCLLVLSFHETLDRCFVGFSPFWKKRFLLAHIFVSSFIKKRYGPQIYKEVVDDSISEATAEEPTIVQRKHFRQPIPFKTKEKQ